MGADSDPRRLHLWTALVLLAVFLAGGVTGAGLVWAMRPHDPRPAGPRPRLDGLPGPLAELGLSPEQVAKARAVVDAHRAELQAAVEESFPRVRAVQDRVDAEIRALLTPEQAVRFDELRKRRPPLRLPGFDGPPPRPPPPGVHPPGPPPYDPGMTLESLVKAAAGLQASDLHLEGGLAACVRVRGQLRSTGEPLRPAELTALARELLGEEAWPAFLERRSADVARTIAGQRCRINVLCTSRGVGLAVRFLSAAQVSLERLNLHPDLARLVLPHHGLVVVSGPTGSGKTSTLAALLQELNRREARHVVTLESPIEYALAPQRCFIRQREVGRDTPSFAQGLYDALREDPDVLVVGELRDPETIQLTLNAAETGHLVLTTMHSSTTAEALQRIVGAFPSEVQSAVAAQLADCLVGVVSQRLRHLPGPGIRAPECEILMASQNARAMIRQGQFFKLQSALETGAADGSWTATRYREWMERRSEWFVEPAEALAVEAAPADGAGVPQAPVPREAPRARVGKRAAGAPSATRSDGVLEIDAADDDLDQIVRDLDR